MSTSTALPDPLPSLLTLDQCWQLKQQYDNSHPTACPTTFFGECVSDHLQTLLLSYTLIFAFEAAVALVVATFLVANRLHERGYRVPKVHLPRIPWTNLFHIVSRARDSLKEDKFRKEQGVELGRMKGTEDAGVV